MTEMDEITSDDGLSRTERREKARRRMLRRRRTTIFALVAVLVEATRADGDDLALLRLLLGGVGDDQAGGSGLLGLDGLDDDAVLERLDGGHGPSSLWELPGR